MGRTSRIVVNGDLGGEHVGVKRSFAGVCVTVIDREIAALDVDSQAMARLKRGGTIADVNREAVDFAGFNGAPV
jgi:hypothetical protein